MLDIAYLALTLACVAACAGVVDRLSRSDLPVPATASPAAAAGPAPLESER
ncbi:hypothetical protein [Dietzia lutea]|uniref:hypothetical protein n=1 Tax=Dietzia lutea TaxID=546160 RepID=UPI00132FECDC|nr:hypothetical protein [Dietzia lutea]